MYTEKYLYETLKERLIRAAECHSSLEENAAVLNMLTTKTLRVDWFREVMESTYEKFFKQEILKTVQAEGAQGTSANAEDEFRDTGFSSLITAMPGGAFNNISSQATPEEKCENITYLLSQIDFKRFAKKANEAIGNLEDRGLKEAASDISILLGLRYSWKEPVVRKLRNMSGFEISYPPDSIFSGYSFTTVDRASKELSQLSVALQKVGQDELSELVDDGIKNLSLSENKNRYFVPREIIVEGDNFIIQGFKSKLVVYLPKEVVPTLVAFVRQYSPEYAEEVALENLQKQLAA